MLKQLYIKNFTLIDELDIQLHPGFSVITGETGAGKSIILGAIGLLLGNRADTKAIKAGCDRCTIEAHFDLSRYDMQSFFAEHDIDYDADDTIIRRELTAAGKSRAFINDTPVSLSLMRELGESLVDIHSQHQNLLLQKEDFQLNVVDIIAQDSKLLGDYRTTYNQYHQARQRLAKLEEEIAKSRENEEFLRFQYKELDHAQLEEGEQESLEQEAETLTHAEDIKTALYEADNTLTNEDGSILERLKSTCQQLASIKEVYPAIAEAAERLDSSYIELKDIAQEIGTNVDRVDFEPARLDEINSRLDTIYSLQQKFHVQDINALIEIREHLKQQLDHIGNSDEELAALQQEAEHWLSKAEQAARKLTELRTKTARKIETEMQQRLVPLGIPNVRFETRRSRQGQLPLQRQQEHTSATRQSGGFGWRDSPCDALTQGNDQRSRQVANHHLRRDRHRCKRKDSREDGTDHGRDGRTRPPGHLHHPPATDCRHGQTSLQGAEGRNPTGHTFPHDGTHRGAKSKRDSADAEWKRHHRGRPRQCAGTAQKLSQINAIVGMKLNIKNI